jgi:tRNA pseudouridine13 synthase
MSESPPAKRVKTETSNSDLSEKIAAIDETEKYLGISVYLTAGSGFSGIVKARYSDFIVHEVGLDGEIARLTNLNGPESVNKPVEETKEEPKKEEEDSSKKERKPYDWPTLQSELDRMVKDSSIAKSLMVLLQIHNKKEESEEKFVIMPLLGKDERRSVHEWVRKSLPCARSDSLDGRIRIWHVKFEKEMPNYKSFGTKNNRNSSRKKKKINWPNDRPDFLRFTLYKENIDTTTATKELSRKGGKARIGYAGMKDKRGITTQYCTLYRTEPYEIASKRQTGGGGNTRQKGFGVVQVGNFEYITDELRLGRLKGNRFDIVLRNVQMNGKDNSDVDRRVLHDAAASMKEKGFVNYFGTQRFGKYNDTHKVGIAVLQGNYRKAIDIIMGTKPYDRPDVAKGRKDWESRFESGETSENEATAAKRVMKNLNRFMNAEMSLMQSLSRKPMDYKRAFRCIPKTLRMMFLHAVQSLIWNRAVSYRLISMNKDAILVGDIVESDGDTKWKPLTQEDLDNKKYTLEDVVIPLIGTKSKFPTNKLGEVMKDELMKELGITVEMFKQIQDREVAIYGDYRKMIVRPKDFDFEIKEYYDPLQPLLQTDLMKLRGEGIEVKPKENDDDKTRIAIIVGFTLPSSSYATVALRELTKKPTSTEYQKDLIL